MSGKSRVVTYFEKMVFGLLGNMLHASVTTKIVSINIALAIIVILIVWVKSYPYSYGSDIFFWLIIFELLSSVIIFLFMSIWKTIELSEQYSRVQNTLEFISLVCMNNAEYMLIWNKYKNLGDKSNLVSLLSRFVIDDSALNEEESIDCRAIISYFNTFELHSLVIDRDIFDPSTLEYWLAGKFVKTWNEAIEPIGALRHQLNNERLYSQWENLANQWGAPSSFRD